MEFKLRDHTILVAVAGSRAYGTHMATSDVDLKGVCVPPAIYYHGYQHRFEQADKASHMEVFRDLLTGETAEAAMNEKLEGSVYEIRKFIKLAADGNPNIWDLLFCRDSEVLLVTDLGRLLRDHRDLFISKKCRFTFGGYARQQLKRINTHRKWLLDPPSGAPTRKEYDLPERTVIPADQLAAAQAEIQKRVDGWELDLDRLDEASRIYIRDQIITALTEMGTDYDERWRKAGESLGMSTNFLELLDRERRYKAAKTNWKQYQDWKNTRNPARAKLEAEHGYDCKHAMHLVRLMRTCVEVFETGEVNIWRPDAEELLAIRNGFWPYESLVAWFEEIDLRLTELYKTSTLPREPRGREIAALCMEIVETALRS